MELNPSEHLTLRYAIHSQKTLGPQIWNSLPEKIKSLGNSVDFKDSKKNGSGLNGYAT